MGRRGMWCSSMCRPLLLLRLRRFYLQSTIPVPWWQVKRGMAYLLDGKRRCSLEIPL